MKNRFLFLLLVFLFFAVSCKVSVNIPKGESINKNVTILPAGTDGSGGTEATYVLYGKWPQSLKDSSVKINTSEKIACGNFEYYLGSDGEYYYLYNDIYYKVEPIKWRVLFKKPNGDWLLFSEAILDNEKFYDNSSSRTINGTTIHPYDYEHSRIRAFLNGIEYQTNTMTNTEFKDKGFFQTAFTPEEQKKILLTKLENSDEELFPMDQLNAEDLKRTSSLILSSDPTYDYVYLLSLKDITSQQYGFAPHYTKANLDNKIYIRTRVRGRTDYFNALYNWTPDDYYYIYGYDFYSYGWWTRTPWNKEYMHYVNHIGDSTYSKQLYSTAQSGVVPAITVSGR